MTAAPQPSPPTAIEPETKNWTWVLDRQCDECGFDAPAFEIETSAATLRSIAASWGEVLRREGVGVRPAPTTWSPLEYACHVRDVLRLASFRIGLMNESNPAQFENWDQDATAVAQRYDLADPATVAEQIVAEAETTIAEVGRITDWARVGLRSDGSAFTIDSFLRYMIHDPFHHLADV